MEIQAKYAQVLARQKELSKSINEITMQINELSQRRQELIPEATMGNG
jgi:prefoldin subunit 5